MAQCCKQALCALIMATHLIEKKKSLNSHKIHVAELCNQFLRLWRDDRRAKWALIIMPYITLFFLSLICANSS